jgi:hypothetical protein
MNFMFGWHGSRRGLTFPLDFVHSKFTNDLGVGFYAGETYEQAATYVSSFAHAEVCAFVFSRSNDLEIYEMGVDLDWMIAIAYFRGHLDAFIADKRLMRLFTRIQRSDVVIAPIADNSMYEIITVFASGEITDEQCKHCLAANQLGKQFVFKSKKALERVNFLSCFYLSPLEKKSLYDERAAHTALGLNKMKLARIEYRGKGRYIEEIFHEKV